MILVKNIIISLYGPLLVQVFFLKKTVKKINQMLFHPKLTGLKMQLKHFILRKIVLS